MKRLIVSLGVVAVAASVLIAGCATAAPAPTPTKAPAAAPAPTKAAEPTKPAAAAPTAAPAPTKPAAAAAPKVSFPEKGKAITLIVPYAAGGPIDLVARTLQPAIEKDLGTPLTILNKPGASTLVGISDMVRSKPDGYTLAFSSEPTVPVTYQDPESKATFGRKELAMVAGVERHSSAIAVAVESPYKTLKDLMDAAKAKPESVKFATTGMLTTGAFPGYFLEEVSGAKFAFVHFDGAPAAIAAVLGGHADVTSLNPAVVLPHIKSERMRVIATTGQEPNKFLPDVKTAEAQGYKVISYSSMGIIAPVSTPKDIVDVLSGAFKRALEDPEVKKKMDDQGNDARYMDPAEYSAYYDTMEVDARKVLNIVRSAQK